MMRSITALQLALVLSSGLFLPAIGAGAVLDSERRISASDATNGTEFGDEVALSGDTALVGGENAVYIHRRDSGGPDEWAEVRKITLPTFATIRSFAIDGDTAIVGAEFDFPASIPDTEVAFIFQRDVGGVENWGEVAQVTASDPADLGFFGTSVAIDGDTAIVGARSDDTAGPAAGAAYVFERDAGGPDNWGEVAKLIASDGGTGDQFGKEVSASGSTAILGADSGAYIFERDEGGPGNWGESVKLVASDGPGFRFGLAVAIHVDTAIVGSLYDDGGGEKSGTAYIFERDSGGPGNWGETAKLTASDAQAFQHFGQSVDISSERAVVGAWGDDDRAPAAGAAYVYERAAGPGAWSEVKKLTASDAGEDDRFGESRAVAVSGNTVLVGAPENDGASINTGAAYVYEDGTVCESGPAICTEWGSGSIVINELSPGNEKLRILLAKGPALSQTDFGVPVQTGGTQYAICLYDDASQLVAQLQVSRADGACAGKPCWKATGGVPPSGKGFRYKDASRSADGVNAMIFKGAIAQAKMILKGINKEKKGQLDLPSGLTAALSGSESATVQVHGHDLEDCFSVTYDNVKIALPSLFKAKK